MSAYEDLPGQTCPAISKAIKELNRWSFYTENDGQTTEVVSLDSAIEALEALREENSELRRIAEERLTELEDRDKVLKQIGDLL